jgi:hypothetical protein
LGGENFSPRIEQLWYQIVSNSVGSEEQERDRGRTAEAIEEKQRNALQQRRVVHSFCYIMIDSFSLYPSLTITQRHLLLPPGPVVCQQASTLLVHA